MSYYDFDSISFFELQLETRARPWRHHTLGVDALGLKSLKPIVGLTRLKNWDPAAGDVETDCVPIVGSAAASRSRCECNDELTIQESWWVIKQQVGKGIRRWLS